MNSSKTTYKLKIPIGELFNFLKINNNLYDTIQTTDRSIKINTPSGFQPINAFVKKQGIVNRFNFENDISIKCDNKHLIKQSNGTFRFIKDVDHVIDSNGKISKLQSRSHERDLKDVFDISLDQPHEYLTSHGIVCHNTSLCKLLTKQLDADMMYINASSENGIDTVRDKITNFATSIGFSRWKIIILDEFSFFSLNAQSALNSIMESTSKHTRFFLTGNYIEKFLPSIVSRCTPFQIQAPPRKKVYENLSNILKAENVEFEQIDLAKIIAQYYPDQRSMLNYCQSNSHTGKLIYSVENLVTNEYCSKILEELKAGNDVKSTFTNIRQIIADSKVRQFDDLFKFLFDNLEEFVPNGHQAAVILHIANYQQRSQLVLDKEIQTAAMFIEILREIK